MGCSGEATVPVYADHRGIVKYSSPSDTNYLSSRNALRRITFNAARQPHLAKKERRRIRAFLGFTDTTAQKYEELLQSWTPETCKWILEEETSLSSWFRNLSRNPMLFWLYGPPETGKSVLSAVIARYIVSYDVGYCCFFHMEAGASISTSLDVVLKSFAYFLSLRVPPFRHALAEIARQKRCLSDSSWKKIWGLIVSLFHSINVEDPIYWVIDGIDHCPDAGKFISSLASMSTLNLPLRVLIVSRPTQDLYASFQQLEDTITLGCLDLTSHPGPTKDLQLSVKCTVEEYCDSNEVRDAMVHDILSVAEGNFLCAHILCQEAIKVRRLDKLEAMLKSWPRVLQFHWESIEAELIFGKDDTKEDVAIIMPWILHIRSPLNTQAIADGMRYHGVRFIHLESAIRQVCGRFAVIDNQSQVKLIHPSARNYILTGKSILSVDAQRSHYIIFRSCLECLKFARYEHGIPVCEEHSFLKYAAKYWHYHFDKSNAYTEEQALTLVMEFFQSTGVLTWIFLAASAQNLDPLTEASGVISELVSQFYPRDLSFIEQCRLDLGMIGGQLRMLLLDDPTMIFSEVALFCPSKSFIHRVKRASNIILDNFNYPQWEDYSTMFTIGKGLAALKVVSTDQNSAISTSTQTGIVKIYCSTRPKAARELVHGERVLDLQFSHSGSLLATYGHLTTKLWHLETGTIQHEVPNPRGRNPIALAFTTNDTKLRAFCTDFIVREMELTGLPQSWETIRLLNDHESIIYNPSCAAFDKSGDLLAVGYRRGPMEVYELDSPPHGSQYELNARSGIDLKQLAWGPKSDLIVGLHRNGALSVWNKSRPNSVHTCYDNVSTMHCSLTDDFLVTGNKNGGLQLWRASDLEGICQIKDSGTLEGLSIEPSCGKIYGIRGSDCIIWEPASIKIATSIEGMESHQLRPLSSRLLNDSRSNPVRVSALAVCTDSSAHSVGFTDGSLKIFPHKGSKAISYSPSNMRIEHMLWSYDKKYLAFVDIAAQVFIMSYDERSCMLHSYITTHLDVNVDQFLFDRQSKYIVIIAEDQLIMWSLDTGNRISHLSLVTSGGKWINHPERDDLFVGCRPQCIETISWDDPESRIIVPLDNSLAQSNLSLDLLDYIQDQPSQAQICSSSATCKVEGLLTSLDGSVTLLTMTLVTDAYTTSQSLTIPTTDLHSGTPALEQGIRSAPLVENISKAMATPLGFIPNHPTAPDQSRRPGERLVFLDHDNFICSVPIHPANREYAITQHLPLPDHWCLPEKLELCQMILGDIYIPVSDQVPIIKNVFWRRNIQPGEKNI